MGRPRAFDWEEAKRLRASGMTYTEIAAQLGVSSNAAACACDPGYRRRQRNASRKGIEQKMEPCRGGCGLLVYAHYVESRQRTGYCIDCWNERRRFAAEMRDDHGTESRYSRGCRCGKCTAAVADARRRRRERSRVPCVSCGGMVDRRRDDKPPECHPCAMRRIRAERKRRREEMSDVRV